MRPTRAGVTLLAGLTMACSTSTTLPRLTLVDPLDGFKMLRPSARATECGGAAFWGRPATRDLGALALARLLNSDDEADAVVNARLEWTWWSIGVYGRRCVTVTGDVVRSIRTVRLPMPVHHGDHAGHETP
jgi:hypothetical protein